LAHLLSYFFSKRTSHLLGLWKPPSLNNGNLSMIAAVETRYGMHFKGVEILVEGLETNDLSRRCSIGPSSALLTRKCVFAHICPNKHEQLREAPRNDHQLCATQAQLLAERPSVGKSTSYDVLNAIAGEIPFQARLRRAQGAPKKFLV
jgi:hypothetical protein